MHASFHAVRSVSSISSCIGERKAPALHCNCVWRGDEAPDDVGDQRLLSEHYRLGSAAASIRESREGFGPNLHPESASCDAPAEILG